MGNTIRPTTTVRVERWPLLILSFLCPKFPSLPLSTWNPAFFPPQVFSLLPPPSTPFPARMVPSGHPGEFEQSAPGFTGSTSNFPSAPPPLSLQPRGQSTPVSALPCRPQGSPRAICSRYSPFMQSLAGLPSGTNPLPPNPQFPPAVTNSILEVTPERPCNLLSSSFLSEIIQAKSGLNLSDCPSTGSRLPLHPSPGTFLSVCGQSRISSLLPFSFSLLSWLAPCPLPLFLCYSLFSASGDPLPALRRAVLPLELCSSHPVFAPSLPAILGHVSPGVARAWAVVPEALVGGEGNPAWSVAQSQIW